MALNDNEIVSVVEIAVYVPTIFVSFFICMRHGFGRSSGWYYTLFLALVRIVGASCQLAIKSNPGDTGLITAAVLLENLGLTPLLLATLGMLSRLVDWINSKKNSPSITVKHFRIIQLVITVGTILAIVGATRGNKNPSSPAIEAQVAVVLYAVTFAATALILLLSAPSISLLPDAERIIVPAVALALPFIAVRVLYSLLLVFVHSGTFSRTSGPVAVRVGMAVVEEFVVVAIYLFLGFRLPRLDKSEQGEILARQGKNGRSNRRLLARLHSSETYDPEHGQSTGGGQSAYDTRPGQ